MQEAAREQPHPITVRWPSLVVQPSGSPQTRSTSKWGWMGKVVPGDKCPTFIARQPPFFLLIRKHWEASAAANN